MRKVTILLVAVVLMSLNGLCVAYANSLEMSNGLAAVKKQDWRLAIKHFSEARKASPMSPHVLYNLALATDENVGSEDCAISWYRAYLAAAPDAQNEKQVLARISDLESILVQRIRELIMSVLEAGPDEFPENIRTDIFLYFAIALANTGNLDAANKIAFDVEELGTRLNILLFTARAQLLLHNDLQGGNKTITLFKEMLNKYDKEDKERYKVLTLAKIAKFQAKAGDKKGARDNIELALQVVEDMASTEDKSLQNKNEALLDIVEGQANIGDMAGAQKTLAKITDEEIKSKAHGTITEAQNDILLKNVYSMQDEVDFWTNEALEVTCDYFDNFYDHLGFQEMLETYEAIENLAEKAEFYSFQLKRNKNLWLMWQKRRAELKPEKITAVQKTGKEFEEGRAKKIESEASKKHLVIISPKERHLLYSVRAIIKKRGLQDAIFNYFYDIHITKGKGTMIQKAARLKEALVRTQTFSNVSVYIDSPPSTDKLYMYYEDNNDPKRSGIVMEMSDSLADEVVAQAIKTIAESQIKHNH